MSKVSRLGKARKTSNLKKLDQWPRGVLAPLTMARSGPEVDIAMVRPNEKGERIRVKPKGEADTLYSSPDDLEELDALLEGRKARQMAPGVYVLWRPAGALVASTPVASTPPTEKP